MDNLKERLAHPAKRLRKPRARKKVSAATIKQGSRRAKLPYPRDYSLRMFYGPGLNPSIDQALFKIVGRFRNSSGCSTLGSKGRYLGWRFKTRRSAIAAANRIINRVTVPGGKLLCRVRVDGAMRVLVLGAVQKIRRVEVWEEAPRRILNVGFQARGKGNP